MYNTCWTKDDFEKEGNAIRQRMVTAVVTNNTKSTPFEQSMVITQSIMGSIMATASEITTTKKMTKTMPEEETLSNDLKNDFENDLENDFENDLKNDLLEYGIRAQFGKFFDSKIKTFRNTWDTLPKSQKFAIKSGLISAGVCAIETIIKFIIINDGKCSMEDLQSLLTKVFRNASIAGLIGYVFGYLTNILLPLCKDFIKNPPEIFKYLIESIGMEMTECCLNRLCSIILGTAFGTIFDVIVWIGAGIYNIHKTKKLTKMFKALY